MPDPDLSQTVVHRPLQAVRGGSLFRLDGVEQSCVVEALGLLRHAFGGQRPAGTRYHWIRISSNREPAEWLAMTGATLLAQSAIDRLTQGAHTLVFEGPSWRQRGTLNRRPAIDDNQETGNAN